MPAKRNATFDAPAAAAEHEPEADEDVGADVGVAPRERAPRRDGAAQLRFGRVGYALPLKGVSVQAQPRRRPA